MEDSLLAVLAEGLSHIDGLAGLGGSDGAPVAVASDHDAQDGCSATAPGIHHRPVTPEEQASSSTNVLLTSSDQEDEEPSLVRPFGMCKTSTPFVYSESTKERVKVICFVVFFFCNFKDKNNCI